MSHVKSAVHIKTNSERCSNTEGMDLSLSSPPAILNWPSALTQITAYGGRLKYAVYYEARDETSRTSYEPQVLIRGGPSKDKVMVRHLPGLQIGQLTRHEVDMTEVSVNTSPSPPPTPLYFLLSSGACRHIEAQALLRPGLLTTCRPNQCQGRGGWVGVGRLGWL